MSSFFNITSVPFILSVVLLVSSSSVLGGEINGGNKAGPSTGATIALVSSAGDNLDAGNVHFSEGELLLGQGEQERALATYEKALEFYLQADSTESQGNAHLRIGEIVVRRGDHARAFTAYSRALACYEKSGSGAPLATVHAHLANLAVIWGDAALLGGKPGEAVDHFNKGLEHAGDDTSDAALLHRKKATAFIKLKESVLAAESSARALAVYEKRGDSVGAATVHKMLGDLHLQGGRYGEATESFARAEALYRKAGDLRGVGNSLRGSGDVFFFSGQTARALESYQAALDLFSKINDLKAQAGIYRIFGEINLQKGANTRALKDYDKALALLEQSGDIAGIKTVYRHQADVLMRMGDNAKALELQTKAESLGSASDSPLEKANKAKLQADIYSRAGENAMALEWYSEALKLYRKSGNLSGEGEVIRAVGDVYANKGDYPLALQQYGQALPLLEKSGDQTGQGNIYQMLGYIAYMRGDNGAALQHYAKAQALFEACRNQMGQINVKKSQADVYAVQHNFAQAKLLFKSVLDFYISASDLESQAYTIFGMAQIAAQEGESENALQLYEEALSLLEKIRRQTGFSSLKKRFMEKTYDLYEEAVVFMIRNNFPAEALRNAESMKARVFLDQLAEGQVVIKNGEQPEARAKREGLEARIADLDLKIADLARGGDSRSSLYSLGKSRLELERELDSLAVNLQINSPRYAAVRYPELVPLQELQKKILLPDETLLEYFVSSEGVYCFVVNGNSLTSVTLPLSRKELDQMAKALLDAVAKGPSRISNELEEASMALYARLLAPLEKKIAADTVIIVPDGILARIPFEILTRKGKEGPRFFLELNPVKYFQSATVLALQRTKFRKGKFSNSFIGFGDPVYADTSSALTLAENTSDTARTSIKMPRLAASGKEILAISEIFELEKRPAEVLLRENANRKNAMAEAMKDYGFIHFAAHGVKYAGYQSIALSPEPSSSDNGMLTISDIMSSSYEKSRLVVLSACQSGLGTLDRGEGVTGLTRAVMYSGSPAAVVSLWDVADSATVGLMESFYENLVSKDMKTEQALRSAKLAMIKSGRHQHPIFWGAFIMYGE